MRISEQAWKIIAKILKPRTLLALLIYGPFAVLCIMQKPIPDALDKALLMLMSAYFGSMFPQQKEIKGDYHQKQS